LLNSISLIGVISITNNSIRLFSSILGRIIGLIIGLGIVGAIIIFIVVLSDAFTKKYKLKELKDDKWQTH